jgi:ABC-type Na+ efflux pump permease subunit
MKRRVIAAAALACILVIAGWIIQIHYGIGTCGPASDTPVLCLMFGFGPFFLLSGVPGVQTILDHVPDGFELILALLLPVIVWFLAFLGLLTLGSFLRRRLATRPRE